jgi:hypothetical protein
MTVPPSKIYISLLFTLLSVGSFGQTFKKVKSVEVSDTIKFAAVDRPGELYILTTRGHLQRFDKDGKLLSFYKNPPAPTLFDPRDGARLFAYFRDAQQYAYLNPSFETASTFKIDSAFVIDPWLICASGDHNIWILDAADWSLKKIDVKHGAVSTEVELASLAKESKEDIIAMREYQGFLFVLDKKQGILIYSSLGNLIRAISIQGLQYFNFLGEELYYPTHEGLVFFNLFSTDTREIKMPAAADFSLITDERLFLIKDKTIEIFEVSP